jgi:polyisoprenoid-binding protein YceI
MARYVVVPAKSQLWAEAQATLHSARIVCKAFRGEFEASLVDGQPRLAPPTRLEIEVSGLSSGTAMMDSEIRRRLNQQRFPRIAGELDEPAHGSRVKLRGKLTLHGVERTIEVDALVEMPDAGTLEIVGKKKIDMRDFGLEPPSLFLLKVQPEVLLQALITARLTS